jgi:hypothetical protein
VQQPDLARCQFEQQLALALELVLLEQQLEFLVQQLELVVEQLVVQLVFFEQQLGLASSRRVQHLRLVGQRVEAYFDQRA